MRRLSITPHDRELEEWEINAYVDDPTEAMALLIADHHDAERELRLAQGRQTYLAGLQAADQTVQQCPICLDPKGLQISILQCGHSLCMNCSNTLSKKRRVKYNSRPRL